MISYPFISALFTNILQLSATIQGRFYVCPKGGVEINSDVLGKVINEIVEQGAKYPLCLMMPPRSTENLFSKYYITLFFLKTTNYGTGNTLNPKTLTSTKSIQADWHDMKKAANSFLEVIDRVEKANFHNVFRVAKDYRTITPVTETGIDRASGVRLDFQMELFNGCLMPEDYNEAEIKLIMVPKI